MKHKHYYCIRAFADGWKLMQCIHVKKAWFPIDYPNFHPDAEYRVVPDENGWLPWYGGECPVDPGIVVETRVGYCVGKSRKAGDYIWGSSITAYRVIEEKADPYAELKAAAKDPNKEIAIRGHEVMLGWHSGKYWKFDCPVEDYVVRDKPKKMKLLAWVEDNGNLTWRREGYVYGPHWWSVWKRAPAEDKEIEVEE